MKKRIMLLGVFVFGWVVIMPIAWATEQVSQSDNQAVIDQLGHKITVEGWTTRHAVTTQNKETSNAIIKAGLATGAAIDRQTEAIKKQHEAEATAKKEFMDRQESINEVSIIIIGGVVIFMGVLLGWLIIWRAKPRALVIPSITVDFEIDGVKYKYTPEIVDGQYQSPFLNQAGNHLLFSNPADLRRSAMAALKGKNNQWLVQHEKDAKRLREVIHLVNQKAAATA